jgi:hypothetical protein
MPLARAGSLMGDMLITDIAIEIEHSYDFMHTGVKGSRTAAACRQCSILPGSA